MDSLEGEISDDVAHIESVVLKSSFTMIAPCFVNLSTLTILDLSRTSIQSLPPSISMLSLLVNLTMQECSMLTELPPEIGMLKNLITFDLEGTEIMYLPKEMGKLENLQCLRLSFCAYAEEYKYCNGIENIIPRTILSKFSKLKELSICVNPVAKWWEVEVIEAIVQKLHFLPCLQILKLYLPTAKELQYFLRLENCNVPIYSTLLDFSLKIGHSEPLTSYLKTKLGDSFEKLEKCVKYENGEGSTDDIKDLVRYAKALFVSRHWTLEILSIFDISRLKYCLLAECNEMHTIVDADEFYGEKIIMHDGKDAFEFLEYLSIHSMKKLQSIWKGPVARNSFSCLQVLALHTCPDLTSVFTEGMLDKLHNLTVIIVEDCPKVNSLVSGGSTKGNYGSFLPSLRKILLLDLPELVSLSSGVYIAPRLDTLLVFNCLKLDYLSPKELSRDVKEIKGETEWWDALKNRDAYSRAFVPLKRDGDLMNQLAEDANSLKEFHKLQNHGGASNKLWRMFVKYLKDRKPPLPLILCNSDHVIEFLKYLNKFGDIRVHVQSCVFFGHPNPAATCFCPLMEAWSTLEAVATRLHAAYEENRFPDMKPFPSREIQSYLNEIRKLRVNALDIPSKKRDFPVLTVEEESDIGWRHEKASPKKGNFGAGTIKYVKQGTVKQKSSPKKEMFSSGRRSKLPPNRGYIKQRIFEEFSEAMTTIGARGNKSADTRTEASTKLPDPILDVSVSDQPRMVERSIGIDMSLLMNMFRSIMQVKINSREHSLSVYPGSTTFPGTLKQGSSSIHEVKEDDDDAISNTTSPDVISHLRDIAMKASSNGCIQPFVEIYIAERKAMLQSSSIQFNIDKWSTYDVKRFEWGVLESLIEIWIKSVNYSFDSLVAKEKRFCEGIFEGLGLDIFGICFEVIIQDYQIQVFNIIHTLSFSNPPPDKLFMILDLYEALDYFLNEMCFFAKQREDPFQAAVGAQLLTVLSDKIISSLSIFEMVLVYHESSVILVGPIDPLPRYVMSYLCQLCGHKHALRKLSLPKLPSIDEDDLSLYSIDEELKEESELSRHVIWIIMMTVSNLEGKAKLCEDGSAGHFFAMKNISYILHNIEAHQELREVVGYDYFVKLIQKLDHAKVNYLRLELEKIIEMRDYGAE